MSVSTPLRYLLFQIPGGIAATLVLAILWDIELLSGRMALLLGLGWILKDVITYPLVRRSYESGAHRHGGSVLIGMSAIVVRDLAPEGYVRIRGELWRAECPQLARRGDAVEVVAAQSMRLIVRKRDAAVTNTGDAPSVAPESESNGTA